MDILSGLLGILLTMIVWLFIALSAKLDSNGPVSFKQESVGEEGRLFTPYKFRSMRVDTGTELAHYVSSDSVREPLFKQKDDPRLTG